MCSARNVLNLSDEAIEKLSRFYENTPELSFEEVNISLLNFLQPIKQSDNISNDYIIKSLIAVKDTIINDKTFIYDKSFTAADNIMINDISDYLPNDLLVKVDRAAMYYGL